MKNIEFRKEIADSWFSYLQNQICKELIVTLNTNSEKNEDKLGNELKLQEHQIILDTLNACHGSRKSVAEQLGISPRTLRYKLARMRDSGIKIPA